MLIGKNVQKQKAADFIFFLFVDVNGAAIWCFLKKLFIQMLFTFANWLNHVYR